VFHRQQEHVQRLTPCPLVAFAGVDAAGKTTHARALVEWLPTVGVPSTFVANQGLGSLRGALNEIATDVDAADYRALVGEFPYRFAVAVQKWLQFQEVIRLAQVGGRVLVLDRYHYCQQAGAAAAGLDEHARDLFRRLFARLPQPELTFHLTVPADVAYARFLARGEEGATPAEFRTLQTAYEALPEASEFVVVDTSAPRTSVEGVIRGHVAMRCLGRWHAPDTAALEPDTAALERTHRARE
jgi:dTMP kinase